MFPSYFRKIKAFRKKFCMIITTFTLKNHNFQNFCPISPILSSNQHWKKNNFCTINVLYFWHKFTSLYVELFIQKIQKLVLKWNENVAHFVLRNGKRHQCVMHFASCHLSIIQKANFKKSTHSKSKMVSKVDLVKSCKF